jgi:hypothetical protein
MAVKKAHLPTRQPFKDEHDRCNCYRDRSPILSNEGASCNVGPRNPVFRYADCKKAHSAAPHLIRLNSVDTGSKAKQR